MRKLIYIANIRMPTEKAHGIQVMKTCEAFVQEGVNVELLVPCRRTPITTDPFEYFGIVSTFPIRRIATFDWVWMGRCGFIVQHLSFSLMVAFFASRLPTDVVYYSREKLVVFLFKLIGKQAVWESHQGELNFLSRYVVKHCTVVTISKGLELLYKPFTSKHILVAPDGVDIKQFNISLSTQDARAQLGLSATAKIVLYAGHLYEWKGVHTVAKTAQMMPDVTFVFIGGTSHDIDAFKQKYAHVPNILILGKKSHQEVPTYLKAANVLVIPNSSKEVISRLYTSPLKLFEYMSSGRPIIASDLPSIREILNENNAIFFTPDNSQSLVASITSVLNDDRLASKVATQALVDVRQYAWQRRAEKILDFISHTRT